MSMVTRVHPLKDPQLKGKAAQSRDLKTVHEKQVCGPILNRFTVV
ncbi:hypothetical protein [Paenibacillus sp. OSY-SE]|nr:hypothetical protein [Paenibacillus sp. OSY-SE]